MTDVISQVWDVLYPEHPPLDPTPSRVVNRIAECAATITDDYDHEAQCPFAGPVDVAVFDDTREALWFCDRGHENSMLWEDFA